jgi:uncharacterized protein (TIGR00251 family)
MTETILKVKVIPNSSRSEVGKMLGDELKVKLMSPPEDGKANKELIKLLEKHFKASVEILSGHTSQHKVVKVFT